MEYKLAAVFFTNHADTVGNSNRLRILKFLSEAFNLVLYTNHKMAEFDTFINTEVKHLSDRQFGRWSLLSDLALWRTIAKKVNSARPDLLFLFHDTAPIALWTDSPCFQYVRQTHEMLGIDVKKLHLKLLKRINEFLILKGLRKSKTIFAVSEPIIEYLNKKGLTNLVLIPHGVHLQMYKNPIITDFHQTVVGLREQGKFVIGYTGWVSENRGLWVMLKGIKESVQEDSKIIFVIVGGEGKYLNIIKNFAEENGLRDNILSYGRIDHSLIPGILAQTHLCLSFLDVIPTYEMSPPQKVIEYFAAGKPVIGNKIKTHEILIRHGVNGLIVDNNAPALAKAILSLVKDGSLREKLSHNAAKSAIRHDFDTIYGKIVTEMKNFLNGG